MSETAGRSRVVAAGVWVITLAAMATLYWASSRPLRLETGPLPWDKLLHFGAYALLAGLWFATLRATWPAAGARGHAWLAAAMSAAYGATDEWHQSFVEGRVADGWDWVADALGAVAVAVVVTVVAARRRRPAA